MGKFESRSSFDFLYRIDRKAAVSLTVHPIAGSKDEVAAFLLSQNLADGELLMTSSLKRNQKHILFVFAFALLLMYLMIGAQFESFILPLLLLASLVPALSGSLVVLLICGYSLNMNSFLGILILTGTAIDISIILTAAIQAQGLRNRNDLVHVCREKLMPVSATVLSTTIAVIPIVVINSSGEGALQSNTAVALLGGLGFGFVAILLIFPIIVDRLSPTTFSRK
jgi:multidrug efflux pump subunit AcrB